MSDLGNKIYIICIKYTDVYGCGKAETALQGGNLGFQPRNDDDIFGIHIQN